MTLSLGRYLRWTSVKFDTHETTMNLRYTKCQTCTLMTKKHVTSYHVIKHNFVAN